jgi:ankyrin repeat protein
MIKERETYTATKGVENEGYEFEIAMLSFYCFHLCYNSDITDFKIAIYDDQYHPFDDIVIDIITEVSEKYAIQLKHVKDKLALNANHFGKNGKMVLSKYFKFDFSKSNHVVLLTNGAINEELTVGSCSIKVKRDLTCLEKCLDTSSDEGDHIYEVSNDENSDKITFYTAQKGRIDIENMIKSKFKEKFALDDNNIDAIFQKFKNFFQQWKKGSFQLCKLDKQDIKMKVAEILFYEYIVEYSPHFSHNVEDKIKLLQKVLNSFNVTVVKDVSKEAISSLCCHNFDEKTLLAHGQELLIIANSEYGSKELATILWRLKEFPLIVRISNDNKKMIYELIGDLRDENLSFVIVGDVYREELKALQVLENLEDLKENVCYQEIINTFRFSIQGQQGLPLEFLIKCNPRFSNIITVKQLLMGIKENFHVGEVQEVLPEPYIPRRLVTTTLEISAVEQFPNDLFVICGHSTMVKRKLVKCKFSTIKECNENILHGKQFPPKSIVLCESHENDCFASCLKYQYSNVHCLKVIDDNYVQLIFSKEKTERLRNFQIFPEDQLHDISTSNINLICARPGMGKLTMLKYLKNNSPPDYWTVKVDLQENQDYKNIFQNGSGFESEVRNCFGEVRHMIFFFCGIDNLQEDSFIQAVEYIQYLAANSYKIWVFSEDHLRETLEKFFEVASMDIEEFTEEEQQQYIQCRLNGQQIDQGLEKVLKSFKMLKNNDILGAPMHLYMLTEIFINNPKANMDEVFVLTDIYRYFMKIKYQHYLNKVCSDNHNQIIEDGIYYRSEQYKLAAISCLNISYFKNLNVQCDNNFLNQIKTIGDVIGVIFKISRDGRVIFSQQTYADYFAALWLASNFKKIENTKSFIFKEEFKNILFMFNVELCKNNPAHIAVLYQNYEQLQKHRNLLADLDPLNRTPLHLACSYSAKYPKVQVGENTFKFNKEIVKEEAETKKIVDYLIKNTTFNPLKIDDLFNWNLLDYAFKMLNLYAIEQILIKCPQTSQKVLTLLNEHVNDLFSIIYYSVSFGYHNLLKLTATTEPFRKALSMEDCNGETLLYLAVKFGNEQIVRVLLEEGAQTDAISSVHNKQSPLHLAVKSNSRDVVDLLLKRGASPDIMDRYRNTPLHLAADTGSSPIADLLLKHGADVNFFDNFGRTPLHFAATKGHTSVLELLLDRNAVINRRDKFGNTPLSCTKYGTKSYKLLSTKGATTDRTTIRRPSAQEVSSYTSYPLHWVSFTGQVERIDQLLSDGWSINQIDDTKRTPLYKAITKKHLKLVEMLIERGADINIADSNHIPPLSRAINKNDYEMTDLLLKNDATVDVKDKFHYTPLHWAAIRGNHEIVKLLLNKNPDTDAVDSFGRKPVDCAVEKGHYEVVKLLAGSASKLRSAESISTFLRHYESVLEQMNDSTRLSPFQNAVNTGNPCLVKKFLNQGSDIDETDCAGYTAVLRAVVKNHKQIVELFLKNNANVNASDHCKSSLLHFAAFCGNCEIVDLLIRYESEINVVDVFGYGPVHIAAMRGHYKTLSVLLKAGGDVNLNVLDQCDNTALDWACKNGHIKSVKKLLKNNAVANTIQEDILDLARQQHAFFQIFKTFEK